MRKRWFRLPFGWSLIKSEDVDFYIDAHDRALRSLFEERQRRDPSIANVVNLFANWPDVYWLLDEVSKLHKPYAPSVDLVEEYAKKRFAVFADAQERMRDERQG